MAKDLFGKLGRGKTQGVMFLIETEPSAQSLTTVCSYHSPAIALVPQSHSPHAGRSQRSRLGLPLRNGYLEMLLE